MKVFAYSKMDAVPAACALLHTAYLIGWFLVFPYTPWWLIALMGLGFSVSISWNINGIAHNFIHNPYFGSPALNRAFSWLLSVTMGFSQQFYDLVHHRHHQGNSDRPGPDGDTVDWLSIYRHGEDGEAENPWTYTFCGYFRDDPKVIFREIHKRSPFNAWFGVFEIASWVLLLVAGFLLNWKFMFCYLPFYYFGHCLSYLNGYFLHYGGNPDLPIAWGVSSYHKLYNLIWFNNGYHAEHHFRPRQHWTKCTPSTSKSAASRPKPASASSSRRTPSASSTPRCPNAAKPGRPSRSRRWDRTEPWFAASVRDIRMLRIEELNDLMPAVRQAAAEGF